MYKRTYMKRLIIEELIKWKNSENRKPIILNGARQVGKTWILKEFGKNYYSDFAYFNCDGNEDLRQIFSNGYNIENILMNLEALHGKYLKGDILIVFDEVQEIPNVLTSLKYFYEERPDLHIAVAGSLLGLSLHKGTGFPVGKVDILNISPMSFSEFILALKGEMLYEHLTKSDLGQLGILHNQYTELLRQYYFVGGMPEAVQAFVNGRSLEEIRQIQNSILYAYNKDISKHSEPREAIRIHQVWQSIPQQLAKENKKFIYGAIRHGARAKDFEVAIQWLLDAGLIVRVNRIKKATIPLKFYEDTEAFKLFLLDCGLLGALSEAPASEILGKSKTFEEYKGSFTEQYVLGELSKLGYGSIYYYHADDSKQELDFLVQDGKRIIPIEVKAEENLRAKSLRFFCHDHTETKGIRISLSQYREQEWLVNLPLYAVNRIKDVDVATKNTSDME